MKKAVFGFFCGISLTSVACQLGHGQLVQLTTSASIYSTQKYQGIVTQVIDKYVGLCLALEYAVGKIEFFSVRRLVFTHPCIIRCYNDMLRQKSVQPLVQLWRAYKQDAVVLDKQKFIYELCHLIAIVFEQFLVKLAADLTGQSVQSLTQLLDTLQIDLPLDDLIDILEQCYQHLSTVSDHLVTQSQQKPIIGKKIIALVLGVTAIIVHQIHYYFGSSAAKTAQS